MTGPCAPDTSAADTPPATWVGVPAADFEEATAWLRPELLAHCYRMLGSFTEAEDQVQETYLRAWRAFHQFDGRSSVRTWMYAIATRRCLSSLRDGTRRVLPSTISDRPGDPAEELVARHDVAWLEPLPDPAQVAEVRGDVALAMVAALQELPARQRAALLMRDVLAFSAVETAEALGSSVAAVNSALQRARAAMGPRARRSGLRTQDLDDRGRRIHRDFCLAFERGDVAGVVRLLATDVVWEMPPFDRWYAGPADVGRLVAAQCPAQHPGDLRLVACSVNGQPGAGMYLRDPDTGTHRPFQLVVLDIFEGAITHVTGFFDLAIGGGLFQAAGLPQSPPPCQAL